MHRERRDPQGHLVLLRVVLAEDQATPGGGCPPGAQHAVDERLNHSLRQEDLCVRAEDGAWMVLASVLGDEQATQFLGRVQDLVRDALAGTAPVAQSGVRITLCDDDVGRPPRDAEAMVPRPRTGAEHLSGTEARAAEAPAVECTLQVATGDADATSHLRHDVRAVLGRWRQLGLADSAELAVTELVGEVRSVATVPVVVRLERLGVDDLHLEVFPAAPDPQTAEAGWGERCAVGLDLVRRFTRSAGTHTGADGVPHLWCEIGPG